jgi:mannose-1-phosphate guanylyltransferase/mannose-1-phosphate guanylyltransferase/mannose-6-phosphate isomerase
MTGREPTERRPWGAFFVLDEGAGYKVKRIVVEPQGRLSLQSHRRRAEHWTVVSGEATVTVGDSVRRLTRGQSADISKGEKHRLENFGTTNVELIEVQFGDYLGEDDIVRYDDVYART